MAVQLCKSSRGVFVPLDPSKNKGFARCNACGAVGNGHDTPLVLGTTDVYHAHSEPKLPLTSAFDNELAKLFFNQGFLIEANEEDFDHDTRSSYVVKALRGDGCHLKSDLIFGLPAILRDKHAIAQMLRERRQISYIALFPRPDHCVEVRIVCSIDPQNNCAVVRKKAVE